MKSCDVNFYGVGTIGERGQIVIPAEARERLKINSGDKFVFFGHGQILHIVKSEEMDTIFSKIHKKFESSITKIKRKIKKENEHAKN